MFCKSVMKIELHLFYIGLKCSKFGDRIWASNAKNVSKKVVIEKIWTEKPFAAQIYGMFRMFLSSYMYHYGEKFFNFGERNMFLNKPHASFYSRKNVLC